MKIINKSFVIVSAILFIGLFITLFGSRVFYNRVMELRNASTGSTGTVNINWEELYPYDTEISLIDENISSGKDVSFLDKYSHVANKFQSLGLNWARKFYWYNDLAKIGYVINSTLTVPSKDNRYVKLNNGYWTASGTDKIQFDDAKNTMAPYASLNNYLKSNDIDFLYCYTPVKECNIDDEYPVGVISYANDNIDTYLKALDLFGVDYIDMRKNLHDDGLEHYSMFYKTDHHWTVQSGLWAADTIVDEISNKYDIKMKKASDFGTYKTVTYENAELGSYGQAITHYVANAEDFSILFPEFNTNYRLEIPNKEIDTTGSFEDIFIDYEEFNKVIEEGGGRAYESILYGNLPYEKITNLNNPDGPKIFMIRDSFAIVVAPYLAASCSELVMVDTRYFTGSIVNCLNKFAPDIVLSLQCGPQSITLNK